MALPLFKRALNLTWAQQQARAVGATIRPTPHGEYRVNAKGGDEATAYYATDLADALGTAFQMMEARRG